MSRWKFVHAADLHLDSPLRGLERYEGAPVDQMRASTRVALENIVDLCLEEDAKFLLLAGDIYDGDWKDFSTGLYFVGQMNRLGKAGISVYIVRGNHDALSAITRGLTLPDNVREFSSRKAESVVDDDLRVALHGRSYRDRSMTDNIAVDYPPAIPDHLNVGILHTCLDGRPGHADYAPCKTDELRSKGYAYWALGHVHDQQTVSEDPWIVWSGTSQGRHAREPGPKGCMLVSVDDQHIDTVEFREMDAVRWWQLTCDVSQAETTRAVLDVVREGLEKAYQESGNRPLAVRVHLSGATEAHSALCSRAQKDNVTNEIRALAGSVGDDIWVEKVKFATTPKLKLDELAQRADAVGGLLRTIGELKEDTERRGELLELFAHLQNRLPPEAREGDSPLGFETVEDLVAMLGDVENLLAPRLVQAAQEEDV